MMVEEIINKVLCSDGGLADLCTWKVMTSNNEKYGSLNRDDKLYDCVICKGTPYECPNYRSHNELLDRYSRR